MRKMSSTPGVFITKTGWTGKCLPTTAGTEEIHAELSRSDVKLMKGGLLAKRLGVKGSLSNPYPRGHTTSPRAVQNMRGQLLDELSGEME